MRARSLSFLAALLCLTVHTAQAEGTGLRLKEYSEGLTLQAAENGLKLRFVPAAPEQASPAPGAEQSGSISEASLTRSRNMLRADWPVFSSGLHTSVGLDWSNTAGLTGSAGRPDAMPLFGLGWETGSRRASSWKLSAEVGTAFVSGLPCNPLVGCPASSTPTGLNPYGYGSGLRLNPYVNFGATFTFGQ